GIDDVADGVQGLRKAGESFDERVDSNQAGWPDELDSEAAFVVEPREVDLVHVGPCRQQGEHHVPAPSAVAIGPRNTFAATICEGACGRQVQLSTLSTAIDRYLAAALVRDRLLIDRVFGPSTKSLRDSPLRRALRPRGR